MALVALVAFVPNAAHAQEAEPEAPAVRLELDACSREGLDPAHLRSLLEAELARDGVTLQTDHDSEAPDAHYRVTVIPCSADAREVQVALDDRLTGKTTQRVFDWSELGPATRARGLVLGMVELLRASWYELLDDGTTSDGSVLPRLVRDRIRRRLSLPPTGHGDRIEPVEPAAPTAEPPSEPSLAWAIGAGFTLAGFFADSVVVFGGRAELDITPYESLTLWGGLGGVTGERDVTLGSVRVSIFSLDLGVDLHTPLDRAWTFGGGAGLRLGWAVADGRSTVTGAQTASGSGVYAAPVVRVRFAVHPVPPLVLGLGAEAGIAVAELDVRAGDDRAGARGVHAGFEVSIGFLAL